MLASGLSLAASAPAGFMAGPVALLGLGWLDWLVLDGLAVAWLRGADPRPGWAFTQGWLMHPNVRAAFLVGFALAFTARLLATIGWLGTAPLRVWLMCPAWLIAALGFAFRWLAFLLMLGRSPLVAPLRLRAFGLRNRRTYSVLPAVSVVGPIFDVTLIGLWRMLLRFSVALVDVGTVPGIGYGVDWLLA